MPSDKRQALLRDPQNTDRFKCPCRPTENDFMHFFVRDSFRKMTNHLGVGNGGGKQGGAALNPRLHSTPYRRCGPDTEIKYRPQKPHGLAKPSGILSKREADTEFQYRPRIIDTDMFADVVFADAIAETSTSFAEVLEKGYCSRRCQGCKLHQRLRTIIPSELVLLYFHARGRVHLL